MTQYWQNSLFANRFNYRTGALLSPYAAASFYGPIAELIALANYPTNKGGLIQPRFPARVRDRNRVPLRLPERARQAGVQPLPRDEVLDPEGNVRWPESAPHSDSAMVEAKVKAAEAVKRAAQEQNETGRAKVRDVVDARNKVERYAELALPEARTDGQDGDAQYLSRFLAGLDRALVGMTRMPASMAAVTDIKPEAAPRNAGEILEDKLQENKPAAQPTEPTQGTKPSAAPRTAGEIFKGAQPKKED